VAAAAATASSPGLRCARASSREFFGTAFGAIKARSDDAFKRLIARFVAFYNDSLFNPHWGESVAFGRDNTMQREHGIPGHRRAAGTTPGGRFLDWIKGRRRITRSTSRLR
jgi:hypothetical protein